MMTNMLRTAGAVCVATWLAGCATPPGTLQVKDVGSYHVGGRAVTLSGLSIRALSFTPGAAPLKIDPNGDFEVEQMVVATRGSRRRARSTRC